MRIWGERKPRPSKHQLNIEIKMLEVERDRAIWERDRAEETNEYMMRALLTMQNIVSSLRVLQAEQQSQLVRQTHELTAVARTVLDDQYKRD